MTRLFCVLFLRSRWMEKCKVTHTHTRLTLTGNHTPGVYMIKNCRTCNSAALIILARVLYFIQHFTATYPSIYSLYTYFYSTSYLILLITTLLNYINRITRIALPPNNHDTLPSAVAKFHTHIIIHSFSIMWWSIAVASFFKEFAHNQGDRA